MADLISVRVDDREMQRAFKRKLKEYDDLSPLMRRLSGVMADSVEENFEQEGRPRWTPLRPRTIKSRTKQGNWPGRILQQRGRLAASIITDHSRDGAKIGTNLIYAGIHQFGGTIKQSARMRIMHFTQAKSGKIGKGDRFSKASKSTYGRRTMGKARDIKMPTRPFLSFADSDLKKMRRMAAEYVAG